MICSLTDEQRKNGILCRAMDCVECKKYRNDRVDMENLNYFDGNVVKYIVRARHKGAEPTDREKALWYVIRGMIDTVGIESALKSVETTLKHFKGDEENTHTIRACHDSDFHGIDCLEDDTYFGFFKSEEDVRPSSCTWIEKDKAEKLFDVCLKGNVKNQHKHNR